MRQRLAGVPLRTIAQQMSVHHTTLIRESKLATKNIGLEMAGQDKKVAIDLLGYISKALTEFEAELSEVRDVRSKDASTRTRLATVAAATQVLVGIRGYLDLLARATGQIKPDGVTINVAVMSAVTASGLPEAAAVKAIQDAALWARLPRAERVALLRAAADEACMETSADELG
jgi:uncharacterized protein YgbK (DUF1537 family)